MLSCAKSRFMVNRLFVLFLVAMLQNCSYGQTEIKKLSLNEAVEIGLKNNPEGAKNELTTVFAELN